jgi:hypothetical protein
VTSLNVAVSMVAVLVSMVRVPSLMMTPSVSVCVRLIPAGFWLIAAASVAAGLGVSDGRVTSSSA